MVAKIGEEKYCRVVEWNNEGDMIARIFCQILGTEILIQEYSGNLEEILSRVSAIVPLSDIDAPADGERMIIEYYEDGDENSEVVTVMLEDTHLETEGGERLFDYEDVNECFLCYNLVKPINQMKSENECCGELAVDGARTIVCSNKPTEECSIPLKQILVKIYEGCQAVHHTDTPEPLTCGTDEEYKEEAELMQEALDANSPEAAAEEAEDLLEDLLEEMPVSGADEAASMVSTITSIITSLTTLTVISTTMTE